MLKKFFYILSNFIFLNISIAYDLPEYIYVLKEYYIDMLYFSRNMQDFSPLKVVNQLELKEYYFYPNNEVEFYKLNEKQTKKIKFQWRFSRSRSKDDNILMKDDIQENYLNIDEKYKTYFFRDSKVDKRDIDFIYYAKDKRKYKFCYDYQNSLYCIYLSFEYYFIKTKNLKLKNDFLNQNFKFKIIGLEDLSMLSNIKQIKIYGEIINNDSIH